MEVLLSFHAARVVLCSEASGHRFLFLRQQKCSSGSPRAYITECRQNNETVWKLVIWPGPQCTMVSVRWLNCGSMICSELGTVEAPVCVLCFRVTWLRLQRSSHAYGWALLCSLWSLALFTPRFPPFLLVCVYSTCTSEFLCSKRLLSRLTSGCV